MQTVSFFEEGREFSHVLRNDCYEHEQMEMQKDSELNVDFTASGHNLAYGFDHLC